MGNKLPFPSSTLPSQVAQWQRICLPMQKTWVQSLGQEDPLEKETATHSIFLPGEFHGQRSLAGYSPLSCKELDTTWWLNNSNSCLLLARLRNCSPCIWGSHSLSETIWTAPEPCSETALHENSPLTPLSAGVNQPQAKGQMGRSHTIFHSLFSFLLVSAPFPPMITPNISVYANRHWQGWWWSVSYIGKVWDQFILSKYLMIFNSGNM